MKKNISLVFAASIALAGSSSQATGIKDFIAANLTKTATSLTKTFNLFDISCMSNTVAAGLTVHQVGESAIKKLEAQGASHMKVAAAQIGLRVATVLTSVIAATKAPCNRYSLAASWLTMLAPIGYKWYQNRQQDQA